MRITIKRVYENPSPADGTRVLIDRIWPRGVSKENARIDEWLKEIAPSNELRKRFGHEPDKWAAFKKRYFKELDDHPELAQEIGRKAKQQKITLVYAAKDERFNNAVVLKEYLENRGKSKG